jgi:hypothetical protein
VRPPAFIAAATPAIDKSACEKALGHSLPDAPTAVKSLSSYRVELSACLERNHRIIEAIVRSFKSELPRASRILLIIKFGYRCFDRILLNGLIQPFQQPERVIGFFNAYRQGERVTRKRLGDIAQQFQNWVKKAFLPVSIETLTDVEQVQLRFILRQGPG